MMMGHDFECVFFSVFVCLSDLPNLIFIEYIHNTIDDDQLIRAVGHLHSEGLVHGDIKPLNIVREGERMKLIDLDACCR